MFGLTGTVARQTHLGPFHHRQRGDLLHSPVRHGHHLVPGNRERPVTPHSRGPFLECLLDEWVAPYKLEHAISIGMALVSVLIIVEPEKDLKEF